MTKTQCVITELALKMLVASLVTFVIIWLNIWQKDRELPFNWPKLDLELQWLYSHSSRQKCKSTPYSHHNHKRKKIQVDILNLHVGTINTFLLEQVAILYKGTKVAEATVVDHLLCMSEIHKSHTFGITDDVPKAKQHQLWEVAGNISSDLTDIQHASLIICTVTRVWCKRTAVFTFGRFRR